MHYFFSDAHLGLGSPEERYEREQIVVRFLEFVRHQQPESLWIVGDLFDYWFDYRSVIPREFVRTLGAIAALSDAGVRVEYLMGNHDFGHRDFFEKELGVRVHPDDVSAELSGHRVLVSHGDGKALNDRGYLMLKKILRARTSNVLWRLLHPDIGIGLALRASRKSRDHTNRKHYGGERPGEAKGLELFAEEKIRSEHFDLVVMGHSHRADIIQFGDGTYVNLGNWIGLPKTYLCLDDDGFELREFESGATPMPKRT